MVLRESREAKRLLERLLKLEPSMAALARKIGVSPSTVRRWRSAAITPPNAGTMLALYEVQAREQKKARKAERDVFETLLKLSGQTGKLPSIRTSEGERKGKQTKGYRWTKRVERELSEEVLSEVIGWIESLRGKRGYPIWQMVVVTSQLAMTSQTPFEPTTTDTSEASYKTVEYMVQVDHPQAGNLVVNMPLVTPRGKKETILRGLRAKLQAILDMGMVRVFIHAVNVFNYRLRTKEERTAYESAQRRERERARRRRR